MFSLNKQEKPSIFGNSSNQNQNQSLFGNPVNNTASTTNTGFGNSTSGVGNGWNSSNTTGFGAKPASSLFGSNNTTNANQNTNSSGSGSLFGQNSNNASGSGTSFGGNTNNAFGSNSNSNSNTGSSLFGGKSASPSGGLFGSTNNTAATTGGGLFGGSTSTSTNTGGLFGSNTSGNTNSNTGGLFGNNSANGSSTSGGLFGNNNSNNASSGALFGNTNTNNSTTGGLFGNAGSTNSTSNTGGLFGNSNSNNTPSAGGLFGNSSSNTNSSGLFGASVNKGVSTGGMFGANLPSTQSGINFGGSVNGNTLNNNANSIQHNIATLDGNPYNYDRSLVSNVNSSMPNSLTESPKPFTDSFAHKRKRRSSSISSNSISYMAQQKKQPSLLSKLSQTFRFFKKSNENVQGLFTPSKKNITEKIAPKSSFSDAKSAYKSMHTGKLQSMKPIIHSKPNGEVSDIKKLVIQTKPTQFHLIDADKVLVKRRRIVSYNPDFAESDNELSDEYDEGVTEYHEVEPIVAPQKSTQISKPFPKSHQELNDESKVSADELTSAKRSDADLGGYWSSPTVEELANNSIEELANVENFIIGRIGFGQIAFNFPVDLTSFKDDFPGLLYGNSVQFNHMFVRVYNGSVPKPSLGKGLNIPATITLERVFPKKGQSSSDYIKYLQKQLGMKFITYDPITGTWVFKVYHFSIWGLVDESDTEVSELKRKQDEMEDVADAEYRMLERSGLWSKRSISEPGNHDGNNQEMHENKLQKLGHRDPIYIPGGWATNMDSSANTDVLVEKNQKIQNDIENQIALLSQSKEVEAPFKEDLDLVISHPVITKNSVDDMFNRMIPISLDINMENVIDEKPFEPILSLDELSNIEIQPNLAISEDWDTQLELTNNMNSSLSPNVKHVNNTKKITFGEVDKMLFGDLKKELENNERIGEEMRMKSPIRFARWDHEGNLLVKKKKITQSGVVEISVKEKLATSNTSGISKVLIHLLSKAVILERSNGYPKVEPSHELSFEDLFVGFSNTSQDDEEKNIISLCSQLLDNDKIVNSKNLKEIDIGNDVLKRKLETIERRQLISNWIKRFNRKQIHKLLKKYFDDPLETVFIHLCANDLTSAIKVAIESCNHHLAVLLTLVDSNDPSVRYAASKQLATWKKSSALEMIPKPVLKIYQLLSGNIFDTDAVINIHGNLSWSISLALSFYYSSLNNSVHDVIYGFNINTISSKPTETDVYYNIMNLYISLIDSNFNLSEGLPLLKSDKLSGKLQWLIFKILSKFADNDPGTKSICDLLSLSFAQQLQLIGLWKEAIFVYTHLSDDETATYHIKELVMQKIEAIKSDINNEKFLVSVLKIPRSLIFEAISLRYRSMGDHWNEASALLDARLLEEAHTTIVKNVAPTAIINGGKALDDLEKILSRFTNSGSIAEWSHGAGIYENYIHLTRLGKDSDDRLLEILRSLIINLPLLKVSNFQIKVASNIISRNVSEKVLDNFIQIAPEKILSLPMGESEMNYFNERLSTVFLKQKILDL